MKEISKIKSHFTKGSNKGSSTHGWYSVYGGITPEDQEEFKKYCQAKGFKAAYIQLSTYAQRPQRTWGSLPEWFKPLSFGDNLHDHSFIFVIYNHDTINGEDIIEFEENNKQLEKI